MAYENYERWKVTPNAGRPLVTVVIPAYNEEVRIIPTIGATASHMSDLGFEWDMIIADDGSTDSTRMLVEEPSFANVRLLPAITNTGKGDAVRRGMLEATGEYVLFMDADSSTPIEQLKLLLDPLRTGEFDVAVGSRHADGADVQNKSLFRKALSGGLHQIVKNVLNIAVRDTQCGFKLFTHEAAQRLFAAQTIDGFSFDLEVLFLAYKLGYRVIEVPVAWYDAPGSKVDAKREIKRFLTDISLIRSNDNKGIYEHA